MWVVNQRNIIDDYLRDGGNLVSFNVLLDKFLATMAVQKPTSASVVRQPSTVLVSQTLSTTTSSSSSSSLPKCIYSFNHKYVDCFYLNESRRPAKWTPKPQVQAEIEKTLASKPWIKSRVEKQIGKLPQSSNTTTTSSSSTSSSSQSQSDQQRSFVTVFHNSLPYELSNSVLVDSGAQVHICNDRSRFTTYKELLGGKVNDQYDIIGQGTIQVKAKGVILNFTDVWHAPDYTTSVLSVDVLAAKKLFFTSEDGALYCRLPDQTRDVVCYTEKRLGQYVLEYQPPPPPPTLSDSVLVHATRAPLDVDHEIWHKRLMHPGSEVMEHLPVKVKGIKTIDCSTCSVSKAHEIVSRKPRDRATTPFSRIHFDLIELPSATTLQYRWEAHFHDDATRIHHVYAIRHKSDVPFVIKSYIARVQRQFKCEVQILHLDGETTLKAIDFVNFTMENGLLLEISAPHTQAQNGDAERAGGVLTLRARAARIGANLPEYLWPEIYDAAAHILNRTPTKTLQWLAPIQELQRLLSPQSTVPDLDLSHLYAYGSRAYPLIKNQPKLSKLQPRSHIGYLVGYQSSNIFRIWVPTTQGVISTRDVTFDESIFPQESEPQPPISLPQIESMNLSEDETSIEPSNQFLNDILSQHDEDTIQTKPDETFFDAIDTSSTTTSLTKPSRSSRSEVSTANILSEGTRRTRKPTQKVLDNTSLQLSTSLPLWALHLTVTEPASKALAVAIHTAIDTSKTLQTRASDAINTATVPNITRIACPQPPSQWNELKSHPHSEYYLAAAKKELDVLVQKETYEVVPRPATGVVLPLKWVFKPKFDSEDKLKSFKARIVVRGDLQDVTFLDTYAATLAIRYFRFFLALSAYHRYDVRQYDAVGAFLNSILPSDQAIYVAIAPGASELLNGVPSTYAYCWRLRRALYGLRTAPLLWHKTFRDALLKLNLIEVAPCFFRHPTAEVFLIFYVDDIAIANHPNSFSQANDIINQLKAQFEIRNEGELQHFLGIAITRFGDGSFSMSQSAYIRQWRTDFTSPQHLQFQLRSHRYMLRTPQSRPIRKNMATSNVLDRFCMLRSQLDQIWLVQHHIWLSLWTTHPWNTSLQRTMPLHT